MDRTSWAIATKMGDCIFSGAAWWRHPGESDICSSMTEHGLLAVTHDGNVRESPIDRLFDEMLGGF